MSKKRQGPPSAKDLQEILASVTDAKNLKPSATMAVANFLYGAPDWEGRLAQDVRIALHCSPGAPQGPIETALEIIHTNLNGCGWEWLLRSTNDLEQIEGMKPYFANISHGEQPSTRTRCVAQHEIASYALIMSLVQAVEIEREWQRVRHGTFAH